MDKHDWTVAIAGTCFTICIALLIGLTIYHGGI